mgnify:CR=1 FL=1
MSENITVSFAYQDQKFNKNGSLNENFSYIIKYEICHSLYTFDKKDRVYMQIVSTEDTVCMPFIFKLMVKTLVLVTISNPTYLVLTDKTYPNDRLYKQKIHAHLIGR